MRATLGSVIAAAVLVAVAAIVSRAHTVPRESAAHPAALELAPQACAIEVACERAHAPRLSEVEVTARASESMPAPATGAATLMGRVLDAESGRGVAGADVAAVCAAEAEQRLARAACSATPDDLARLLEGAGTWCRTDFDGGFELTGLAMGPHVVVARARDHLTRIASPIAPGMCGAPVDLLLEREVRARGRVLDADGVAVANAVVAAMPSDDLDQPGAPRATPAAARTDESGHFTVRGLDAGAWVLCALAPGRPAATRSFDRSAEENVLRLPRPASVRGIVRRGTTVAADVHVTLSSALGASVVTDRSGRFEIAIAAPGPARLQCSLDREGALSLGALDVELADGEQRWFEIDLPEAPELALSGELRVEGLPRPSTVVTATIRDAQPCVGLTRVAKTDENGRFTLPALPLGAYVLEVWLTEGGEVSRVSFEHELRSAVDGFIALDLQPARIDGELFEAWTNEPGACVPLGLERVDRGVETARDPCDGPMTTDASGCFSASNLAPGTYRVTWRDRDGARRTSEPVVLAPSQRAHVEVAAGGD